MRSQNAGQLFLLFVDTERQFDAIFWIPHFFPATKKFVYSGQINQHRNLPACQNAGHMALKM